MKTYNFTKIIQESIFQGSIDAESQSHAMELLIGYKLPDKAFNHDIIGDRTSITFRDCFFSVWNS